MSLDVTAPPAPAAPPIEVPARALVRVPYSVIRQDFIGTWGYAGGKFEPEHLEILGPSGTGKTYFEATALRDRVAARNSAVVFIATKPLDETILMLGWPIVDTYKAIREDRNRQCIYWPQTNLVGEERDKYLESKFYDLLARLWAAKAKIIVAFDEIGEVERLSQRLKKLIHQLWTQARSVGITLVAMKQRPQGVQRDMHSESGWLAAFRPKDEDDGIRVAQVMGSRRIWLPILMSLNRAKRELVLQHVVSGEAVITWVDIPFRPARQRRGHPVYGGT